MNYYLTIKKQARTELEIKKSRFITTVKPVATEEEAKAFISDIQSEFKDATHNVYAYQVGLKGEIQRMSDDGEPQGTSGPPVLEVIKKEQLTNVAIVVTRYFGGIMLGAGGLIRAYGQAAKLGIEAGQIVERGLFEKVTITVSYQLWGTVQHFLNQQEYAVDEPIYEADVKVMVYIKIEEVAEFKGTITDLTNGQVLTDQLGTVWL